MQEATKVPLELINRIIYFCHPSALCCWCLVSSIYLPEAQMYLYRDITFVSHWSQLPSSQFNCQLKWGKVTQFLDSIRQNNRLARLIQELTLRLEEGPWPAQVWGMFLNGFPAMTNLVRFRFICPLITTNPPTLERLLRGTSMKLKELEIYTDALIDHHDYLAYFLLRQGDLKILSLRCKWNWSVLQPDSCPHLEALTTWSRGCMEAILQERPVVKLCWDLAHPLYHYQSDDYHLISPQLSQAFSKIRILILLQDIQVHGELLLIAPHLLALEVLDLGAYSEANAKNVLKLEHLRVLIMRQETDLEHQRALRQDWFPSLATLQLLFLRDADQDRFSRWERGVEEHINVSYAEITPFLEVENLPVI